jgi:hypothetical protein
MIEKVKAVKKTPDAFPATLKFFKLARGNPRLPDSLRQ